MWKDIVDNFKKIDVAKAFKKNAEALNDDVMFVVMAILVVVALIAVAYALEVIVDRKVGRKDEIRMNRTKRMVVIAMLSAIAIILNLMGFHLPFLPSFYKVDFSELPVVIGAFVLGPTAGIVIEFIKIMLNIALNGTTTAFVGEFANFVIGCCFVVPAGMIYFVKRKKLTACIGLVVGTVVCCVAGALLNAYVLLPMYSKLFHMDMAKLIGMGTKVNSAIKDMPSFIMLATVPLNLIKCVPCSIVSFLIYKPIRKTLMK